MARNMAKKAEIEEQKSYLREWFPRGGTVYTILRHVSRSGMRREIGIVAILSNKDVMQPNWSVATVLGLRQGPHDGVIVTGVGMDMGFHIVHLLSVALYDGDGRALNHRWL